MDEQREVGVASGVQVEVVRCDQHERLRLSLVSSGD